MTTRTALRIEPATTGPPRPLLLVEMAHLAAAEVLPAAAAQAASLNARLLVGIARPRPGFTTDIAIAQRAAGRDQEDCLQLMLAAHGLLEGTRVDYELALVSYRQSRVPQKRARRIAAAMSRLAKQRGAVPLASMPLAAPPASTVRAAWLPASRYRPAHIVAVLPDSAEAVAVARAAADLATSSGRPLALVVPVPGLFSPRDRGEIARGYGRMGEEMAAIAGRVRPTLDALGVSAHVYCAPFRTDDPAGLVRLEMAAAIDEVAHLLRAQTVVISSRCPAAQHLRVTAGLHIVPAAVADALPLPARRTLDPSSRT